MAEMTSDERKISWVANDLVLFTSDKI